MNCPECRAIMEDCGVTNKCTKCPRKWPMSIAEVKGDYPGYLMHEIITARSVAPKEAEHVCGTNCAGGCAGERGCGCADGTVERQEVE